jgi:hypothetical protein
MRSTRLLRGLGPLHERFRRVRIPSRLRLTGKVVLAVLLFSPLPGYGVSSMFEPGLYSRWLVLVYGLFAVAGCAVLTRTRLLPASVLLFLLANAPVLVSAAAPTNPERGIATFLVGAYMAAVGLLVLVVSLALWAMQRPSWRLPPELRGVMRRRGARSGDRWGPHGR